MPSRREFLKGSLGLFAGSRIPLGGTLIWPAEIAFLRNLAKATIASATKQDSVAAARFAFVTPGGDYPSLWVRDFSMAAGCGLIDSQSIESHLRLIARVQNGASERRLASGGVVPPFAIPDHIRYDGQPVFYPGTYSSGEDQGGEPWGVLPPVDDHYEFVHLAHLLARARREVAWLDDGLWSSLKRALEVPASDPDTGCVVTQADRRAVGFGFCDAITLTGSLLFATLLRYRALGEMIELSLSLKQTEFLEAWRRQRRLIESHLGTIFFRDGWLLAATGIGSQPDVWGSAFAVHLGAIRGSLKRDVAERLASATKGGTITWRGAVRHVPTDHDFSATSAWEKTAGVALNRYQNGAYWHVATGWLVSALNTNDTLLARRVVVEMLDHFRQEDFRRGRDFGAPWECIHPDSGYRQNRIYAASVTLPLEVLQSLG